MLRVPLPVTAIPESPAEATPRRSCLLHLCTFSGQEPARQGAEKLWHKREGLPREEEGQDHGLGLDYTVLILHVALVDPLGGPLRVPQIPSLC